MPKEGLLGPPHTVFICVLKYAGTTMPPVGLGTWKNDPGHGKVVVKYALSFGYHHTDCAVIGIGEALKENMGPGKEVSKTYRAVEHPAPP